MESRLGTKRNIFIYNRGTTCKVGILEGPVSEHKVIASEVIPTVHPKETVKSICAFFNSFDYEYSSMGVAAFGPICLDKSSEKYGYVTTTPKEHWDNFPLLPSLLAGINRKAFKQAVFDTDVNVVALFSHLNGVRKAKNMAYITVGTGIGIGIVVNGEMVHGLIHPEGGHIRVPILPEDREFPGVCKYHGNCLEGLCTNVGIQKRVGLATVEDNAGLP